MKTIDSANPLKLCDYFDIRGGPAQAGPLWYLQFLKASYTSSLFKSIFILLSCVIDKNESPLTQITTCLKGTSSKTCFIGREIIALSCDSQMLHLMRLHLNMARLHLPPDCTVGQYRQKLIYTMLTGLSNSKSPSGRNDTKHLFCAFNHERPLKRPFVNAIRGLAAALLIGS